MGRAATGRAILPLMLATSLLTIGCAGQPAPALAQPTLQATASATATKKPAPPATETDGCLTSPAALTVHRGDQPAPVCLHIGATLSITTDPSPMQPWQPITSANDAALRCTSIAATDGAAKATCTAVGAGTTTISTTTAPFSADPHGPAQQMWTLTVTIR